LAYCVAFAPHLGIFQGFEITDVANIGNQETEAKKQKHSKNTVGNIALLSDLHIFIRPRVESHKAMYSTLVEYFDM